MNEAQCLDYLAACAACDASGLYEPSRDFVRLLGGAAPRGEWQAAVCAANSGVLSLALRPEGPLEVARAAELLALRELRLEGKPALSRPWLETVWDIRAGKETSLACSYFARGGETLRALRPALGRPSALLSRRFSPSLFPEPVSSVLRAFHELAPLSRVQTVARREGWRLMLERPLPWPLFLRCDLASGFSVRAAQLSLLLRDALVVALDFDGEALWARVE